MLEKIEIMQGTYRFISNYYTSNKIPVWICFIMFLFAASYQDKIIISLYFHFL